jgi:hypothetical protein
MHWQLRFVYTFQAMCGAYAGATTTRCHICLEVNTFETRKGIEEEVSEPGAAMGHLLRVFAHNSTACSEPEAVIDYSFRFRAMGPG